MTDLLAAALEYAARGIPVLPLHTWNGQRCDCSDPDCSSPAKHPRTAHGLKDATVDPDTTAGWWHRWPAANIGLRTGVVFDVLDIDGGAGWDQLARLVAEHGCLPSGAVSMTGGGGAHYLVEPTGLGNRTGIVDHVDWRGRGGYIVAPPSIHANGAQYEWAIGLDEVPVQPAPVWLVDLLKPAPAIPMRTTAIAGRERDPGRYGRAALEQEVGRLLMAPVGQRNDQLNRSTFALGQLVAGGVLDLELVVDTLLEAAQRVGLAEDEIERTMTGALRAGMARPRRLTA